MKYNLLFFVFVFIFILSSCSASIDKDTSEEEGLVFNSERPSILVDTLLSWPFGKTKAVCFTWDDGVKVQTLHIAQLFKKYGLSSTFYIITKNLSLEECALEYVDVLLFGNEIGSHTVNHLDLTSLTDDEIEYEVYKSSIDIRARFGYYPATFSHPNRKMNNKVDSLLSKYYLSSRFSSIIAHPDRIVHTIFRSDSYEKLTKEFDSFIRDDNYNWIVYSGHGLSSNTLDPYYVYEPIDSLALDSFLSYVTTNYHDEIYVATYEDIAMYQYLQERVKLKFGDGIIGVVKTDVNPVLDRYSHPKALVSLVFDSENVEVHSKALVDVKRKDNKTIVTLDIRKGTVLYYGE